MTYIETTGNAEQGEETPVSYQEINKLHPELEDLAVFSAEWYRQWRTAHLAMFPNSDRATRANLDDMVAEAEAREADSQTAT